VKLYFTHLFYLRAILRDIHYQGQMKQWAIENFIFLELERKLGESHDFAFYRKKSGAEITFIVTDRENTLVTPIEVNVRETDAVSQAIKTFDTDYHDRVERYMLWNDSRVGKKSLEDKTVMILPHIAI
jgi:predicted AAA+ superfamily ATPase